MVTSHPSHPREDVTIYRLIPSTLWGECYCDIIIAVLCWKWLGQKHQVVSRKVIPAGKSPTHCWLWACREEIIHLVSLNCPVIEKVKKSQHDTVYKYENLIKSIKARKVLKDEKIKKTVFLYCTLFSVFHSYSVLKMETHLASVLFTPSLLSVTDLGELLSPAKSQNTSGIQRRR